MRAAPEQEITRVDTYCTKCGEPWAVECLSEPAEYELTVSGGMIVECGGCAGEPTGEPPARAMAAAALHDLMPDDPDGVAAMLEDADYLGLL